jgi:hypothetical protein
MIAAESMPEPNSPQEPAGGWPIVAEKLPGTSSQIVEASLK